MKKKRIEYRYRFDGLFMCMSSLKKYRAAERAAAPCSEQSHHAKLVSSWMRHGCRVTWCPHGVTQQALGAATKGVGLVPCQRDPCVSGGLGGGSVSPNPFACIARCTLF